MQKLFTVEEHYSSARITDQIQAILGVEGPAARRENETQRRAEDLGKDRIAYLDSVGITRQVIGCADDFPSCMAAEYAVPLCRDLNDEMAEKAREYPDRYACFAALPLSSPSDAASELERCVLKLGFVGAMLAGHVDGCPYDDEWYFPIFAKASELGVPVYLHPCPVDKEIKAKYYQGAWSAQAAALFAGFGIGWHYDAGMQALRMMMAGVFDRLPALQIILGHWGEVVSFFARRLDEIGRGVTGLKKDFSDYFKENVYVNPSGMLYGEQFRYCLEFFGPERILWGQDYPYRRPENIRGFLEDFPLDALDREKIAWQNAEKLFRL